MAVTQTQVASLYVATFNRAPDAAGLAYWVNTSFGGHATIEQIAQSFFNQAETQTKYPTGTTDAAFVTSIYSNLFNRAPDAAGLTYLSFPSSSLVMQTFSSSRTRYGICIQNLKIGV